jgi:hypothetical protein
MVIADTATITSAPKNGKLVYLTEVPDKKDLRIVILCDADGSNKVTVDTGEYIGAELSPSGEFIILTTRDPYGIKAGALYRVFISGSTVSDTVRFKGIKLEHDILPALSPDGNLIAFVGDNGTGGKEELFIIHSDGSGTPNSLGDVDLLPGECITWSPDSKFILCHGDESRKFVTIRITDGFQRVIPFPTKLKPDDATFGVEPETFLVAAAASPSKAINLYEVKETGGGPSTITSTITTYSAPNWAAKIGGYSSDTTFIVYSVGDISQFTKTMNVYDRLLQKDTTLDSGVTECFFAK